MNQMLGIYYTCLWDLYVTGQEAVLLWCNFEVFLHSLHHQQMVIINPVCFSGLCLVVLISCRTCSTEGWRNLPLRPVLEEELDDIIWVVWYQYPVQDIAGIVCTAEGKSHVKTKCSMWLTNQFVNLLDLLFNGKVLEFVSNCLVWPGMLGMNHTGLLWLVWRKVG